MSDKTYFCLFYGMWWWLLLFIKINEFSQVKNINELVNIGMNIFRFRLIHTYKDVRIVSIIFIILLY